MGIFLINNLMAYKTKFFPKNVSKYIGNPESIICRSLWERKFCKYLDENKNILRWSFENIKIPYLSPMDNQMHFYIPDFMVEKKGKDNIVKTLVVEIKPYKQTKQPILTENVSKRTFNKNMETFLINQAKWKAADQFCKQNDIEFIILTEKELL
jgi:hypothetical protein